MDPVVLEDLRGVVDGLRASISQSRLKKQQAVLSLQALKKQIAALAKEEKHVAARLTRLQLLLDELEVEHDAKRTKTQTEFTPEAEEGGEDF